MKRSKRVLSKFFDKTLSLIMSAVLSLSAVCMTAPEASAAWTKSKSGYSYRDDESGKKLTGWQTIDGELYCFNKEGFALTGWNKVNGKTYYFNGAKRGRVVKSWAKIKGKQYYFGTDGVMRTGWVKINGKTYYFGSDGVMLSSGTYRISGKICTFGADGVLREPLQSDSFITDPFKGLIWGQTKDQVTAKLDTENYIISGNMIIVCDAEPFRYYIVSDSLGLCAYGYIQTFSAAAVNEFNSRFQTEGWKYESTESGAGGESVYLYTSERSCGAVVSNGKSCMTMVMSDALAADIGNGNVTDIVNV
ncbi:MAG: hypothetical protein K2K57_05195 [Oscillospiraceae bacterium]|nr:hypothetical protein [Oscillospiraceae bacterium]